MSKEVSGIYSLAQCLAFETRVGTIIKLIQ